MEGLFTEELLELRKKDEALKVFFENSCGLFFWYDVHSLNIREVNTTFLIKTGYSKEELIDKNLLDICAVMDNTRWAEKIAAIFKDQTQPKVKHLRLKCQDDSFIDVSMDLFHSFDDQGNIVSSIGVFHDITDKAKLKTDLDEALLRQNEIIKAANVGLWDWNLKTNKVVYSREWKSQIGYEEYEISNDFAEWQKRVHPDDLKDTLTTVDELVSGLHKNYNIRFRFRHKNGTYRYILAQASVITDENNEAVKVLGSHLDITEQYLAEQKNIINEEKYKALYLNAPLAYQSLDENGFFIDVNPAWLNILGYERDEVIGKNYASFLHRDFVGVFEENFPAFKQRGYVNDVQFKLRHKKGHFIDVSFEGCIGYQPDGSFRQTYCVFRDITQEKKALENLEHSENKYRSLFNNMAQGVFYQNREGDVIDCNPAALEIFGLSREEMMGRTEFHEKWDVVNDAGEKLLPEEYPSVIALKEGRIVKNSLVGVFNYVRDEYVYVLVNAYPLFQKDEGIPYQVFVSMYDVTDKLKAEKELKDSQERLSLAMEATNDGLWDWDIEKNDVFWSKKAYNMLGYEDQEFAVSYERWQSLILPEDLAISEPLVKQSLMTGEPFSTEFRMRRKDGGWQWILGRGRCVKKDSEGKPLRMLGTHLDLSERKKAEKELKKERDFIETIFNTTQAVIVLLDRNGRIIKFNKFLENLSGYSYDEISGQDWFEKFLPSDDHNKIKSLFSNVVDNLDISGNINPILNKKGEEIPVEWYSKTLKDNNGETIGVLSAGIDISQRLKMEERLQQSEKMKAIGQLAGGIAHDFNNILAGILGYADIALLQVKGNICLKESISNIITSANRAKEMVEQILSFSRQGSKEKKPVLIKPLLEEVLSLLKVSLPSSINIETDFTDDLKPVMGNSTKLHEVIVNLCANASHAMDGRGKIKISYGEVDVDHEIATVEGSIGPGKFSLIKIADNGKGMSKDVVAKIFDPFFTTKPTGQGTGMGLAVVHGIIKSHEGGIQVESIENQGSEFYIYLPKTESVPIEEKEVDKSMPRGNESIMFVDDELMLCKMCQSMLSTSGYQADIFSDPLKALNTFANNPDKYDLVITDQTMPGLSGVELAKKLLKIRKNLPIIICSGYSKDFNKEDYFKAGIKSFCMKPFRHLPFIQEVRKVLDQ